MRGKWTIALVSLALGLLVGGIAVYWFSPRSVFAQTGWQCRTWHPAESSTAEIIALQAFLGLSRPGSVLISTAPGPTAGKYTVVACKL